MIGVFLIKPTEELDYYILFENGSIIWTTFSEDEELNKNILSPVRNYLPIFIDVYTCDDFIKLQSKLCDHAIRSLKVDNAGGASYFSEALSIQYFHERFNANNFVLEMEIKYAWSNYKMCDFICTINNRTQKEQIGVSVTRAMGFPTPEDFDENDAYNLLKKKMHGLVIARDGVCTQFNFDTCFLHIWCQTKKIADLLKKVYPKIIEEDEKSTVHEVIVIASVNPDKNIYYNKKLLRSNIN